jgi:hypothetical protein
MDYVAHRQCVCSRAPRTRTTAMSTRTAYAMGGYPPSSTRHVLARRRLPAPSRPVDGRGELEKATQESTSARWRRGRQHVARCWDALHAAIDLRWLGIADRARRGGGFPPTRPERAHRVAAIHDDSPASNGRAVCTVTFLNAGHSGHRERRASKYERRLPHVEQGYRSGTFHCGLQAKAAKQPALHSGHGGGDIRAGILVAAMGSWARSSQHTIPSSGNTRQRTSRAGMDDRKKTAADYAKYCTGWRVAAMTDARGLMARSRLMSPSWAPGTPACGRRITCSSAIRPCAWP